MSAEFVLSPTVTNERNLSEPLGYPKFRNDTGVEEVHLPRLHLALAALRLSSGLDEDPRVALSRVDDRRVQIQAK
jgi:hypothetical protein